MKCHAITSALMLAVLVPTAALAAIFNVPNDFDSIDEAVESSSPGDTVQVSLGTYAESVDVRDIDTITIEGLQSGGVKPVLQPGLDSRGFRLRNASGVTIRGFRIEGGNYGVRVDATATAIEIVDNEIEGAKQGIRIRGGAGHILH